MTPYGGDIEDVERAIAQRLRSAAFRDVLAAVDAGKGDGTTTPGPVSVFEGEKVVQRGEGYPVAHVIGIRTAYASDPNIDKERAHQVQVEFTQTGEDETAIKRHLQRLVRATVEFFWPAGTPGITLEELRTTPVIVRDEEYSALGLTDEHPPFIKAASLQLLVTTFAL